MKSREQIHCTCIGLDAMRTRICRPRHHVTKVFIVVVVDRLDDAVVVHQAVEHQEAWYRFHGVLAVEEAVRLFEQFRAVHAGIAKIADVAELLDPRRARHGVNCCGRDAANASGEQEVCGERQRKREAELTDVKSDAKLSDRC